MNNQYRLSNIIGKNRTLQIKKIINDRRFEIAKINDSQLREELNGRLLRILDIDSSESTESSDYEQEETAQNQIHWLTPLKQNFPKATGSVLSNPISRSDSNKRISSL